MSVACNAPDFEHGSSRLLSFAKKPVALKAKPETAKVWSIMDTDDDEVELMNGEDLLDQDDLAKPDQASLRGNQSLSVSQL